jgi:hypothetical protein
MLKLALRSANLLFETPLHYDEGSGDYCIKIAVYDALGGQPARINANIAHRQAIIDTWFWNLCRRNGILPATIVEHFEGIKASGQIMELERGVSRWELQKK